MKRLLALLAVTTALVFSGALFAQTDTPTMSASADPREVDVGEAFTVSFSDGRCRRPSPSDPRLGLTTAFGPVRPASRRRRRSASSTAA
jgi:hypothetical protein